MVNSQTLKWFGAAALMFSGAADAHVRWDCPIPRSTNSAIKNGPCGSDNLGLEGIDSLVADKAEISPGPLTVRFEETIRHLGSPYRIALSKEGVDDYEDCILLNHIPHYDDVSSGHFTSITIDIPDVQCDNCALQVIQVMTDKIPSGTNCTYDVELSATFITGNCFSNYHSCANIRINGTTARDDYTCAQPEDWPFIDGYQDFEYGLESAAWGAPVDDSLDIGGLLVEGAERFNEQAGDCMNAFNPDDVIESTDATTSAAATTTTIMGTLDPDNAATTSEEGSGARRPLATFALYAVGSLAVSSMFLRQ